MFTNPNSTAKYQALLCISHVVQKADNFYAKMSTMTEAAAGEITKEVFDLFREYGNRDYIGEPVSQQEHMTQCAMLAEKEGYAIEVILGAFLHDIGHLVGMKNNFPSMGEVGTQNHETVGEKFLKDLGFPQTVTSFVRGHVEAKRYLVFKYPDYYDKVGLYVNDEPPGYPVVPPETRSAPRNTVLHLTKRKRAIHDEL